MQSSLLADDAGTKKARDITVFALPGQTGSSSSRHLIQLKRLVQHAHSKFQVLLVDHHRDLDLRGGDHLDVDALLGQRAEHLAGDADVGAHADADHRDLGDPVVAGDLARGTVKEKSVEPS